MRLVVDTIRGEDVYKALNILKFTKKEAGRRVEKLLLSAISNWEQKHELDPEDSDLYVKEVFVNQGRTLKRYRPAPQGRATRIRKRSNHVTLVVASRSAAPAPAALEEVTETEEVNED